MIRSFELEEQGISVIWRKIGKQNFRLVILSYVPYSN